MRPPSRRPTQEDVARLAGVSRGTVSLVLNPAGGRIVISADTRARVLDAARQLGYSPNPVAQMLASGRNRIIGFFTFEQTFPYGQADFHHRYLFGIEREACERDFDLLLFTRGGARSSKTIFRDGMNALRLADGSIFIGTDPDPEGLRRLLDERYPFVLIGRTRIPADRIDTVVHDHASAASRAARHLLELGHRRIAVVVHATDFEFIRDRIDGGRAAVETAAGAELMVFTRDEAPDAAALDGRIARHGVTALVVADRRSLAAVQALTAADATRVPRDLSVAFLVTGEEDSYARASRVVLNRANLGRIAFHRLIDRLEGRLDGFGRVLVPCDFAPGATTGPAP